MRYIEQVMRDGFPAEKVKRGLLCLLLLLMAIVLWACKIRLQIFFDLSVIMVFLVLRPKYMFSPKTVIFFYYMMWYVIAPLFANRYKNLYMKNNVDLAFLMLLSVYIVSMVVIDLFTDETIKYIMIAQSYNYKILRMLFIVMGIVGLVVFVHRTGGLSLWLINPYAAFFSRSGSGAYYLLFEYGFLLYLFFEGASGRRVTHPLMMVGLLICIVVSYFIGSKAAAFILFLMLFNYWGNQVKVVSSKTLVICMIGILVFIYGMFVRVGELMTSINSSVSTMLNYFDTLDEFLIVLRDFKPSWFMTCFMPLNWLGARLGLVSNNAIHDMSIWLTTIYYPDSWANGGTHQWPIEADMYLNYSFVFGFPMLFFYFWIIAKLYQFAQNRGGIWMFIYINEWFGIIGHLRGGIFLHLYWYLIPFYSILVQIDKRLLCKVNRVESERLRNRRLYKCVQKRRAEDALL